MRALTIGLILLLPAWALAQTTTVPAPAPTAVDVRPFFNDFVWPILGVIGFALATWIGQKLVPLIGVNASKVVEDRLNKLMQEGLQAGQLKMANSNIERFDVQSEILAKALNYVGEHGAADLKKAGLTEQALKERLEALLAPAVMVAQAQPGEVTVATAATQANPAIATAPIPLHNKE